MNVAVVGANGFVGKHLCKSINAISVDLPEYDITSRQAVNRIFQDFQPTHIINLAAMSHTPDNFKFPRRSFDVNTRGVLNLLEACRWHKVKQFIQVSTVSVHGSFGKYNIDETYTIRPENIYGATKASAELMVMAYARVYNVRATIIRTSGVYGSGDTHPRLVKNFVNNAIESKPLIIKGDGLLKRDFTYVKDLCEGIRLAVDNPKAIGEIFNITGGRTYSLNDLASTIQRLVFGTRIEYQEGRKIDLQRGEVSIDKAKRILGYVPKYTLEEGLKEMI